MSNTIIANECQWVGCTETRLFVKPKKYKPYYKPYCRLHLGFHISETRNNGKGDRYINEKGYVFIKLPYELNNSHAVMAEHRYVMETILGRKMKKGESVHHKNGDKTDNRPANLELWVGAVRSGQRATEIICPHCKLPYVKKD